MRIIKSFVSFCGLFLISGTLGAHYKCSPGIYYDCTIRNLTIETTLDATTLTIEEQPTALDLKYSNIAYLSPELLASPGFAPVKKLLVLDGTVPKIYIKSGLLELRAFDNKLETLIIPTDEECKLQVLSIGRNLLTEVPSNIERCKKLQDLTLGSNQIQTVNLSLLDGFEDLQFIDLSNNQIHSIEVGTVLTLPSLYHFDLTNNSISHVDMKKWNFPKLDVLIVASNQLRSIDDVVQQFPSLTSLDLTKNSWSCGRLNDTINSFENTTMKLWMDEKCSGSQVAAICCQM